MNSMYRFQRHFYDLTRKPYLLGRDRLIAELDVPKRGAVLEVGCGTGRNLIAIARRYPDARCHGVDVSTAMLDTASRSIGHAGLRDRIEIAFADAVQFDPGAIFAREKFDRVVISYALSMIPAWRDVLASAIGLAARGGSVHVVDFGSMNGFPTLARRGLEAWLRMFSVTPRRDLVEVCETLAARRGARSEAMALYGGYATLAKIRLR